jgi:DNA-directed RNA polymerase subunit RPC12/RpoP
MSLDTTERDKYSVCPYCNGSVVIDEKGLYCEDCGRQFYKDSYGELKEK